MIKILNVQMVEGCQNPFKVMEGEELFDALNINPKHEPQGSFPMKSFVHIGKILVM
jgi:hypothetical protein